MAKIISSPSPEVSRYIRDPYLEYAEFMIAHTNVDDINIRTDEQIRKDWNEARDLLSDGRYADLEALVRIRCDVLVGVMVSLIDGGVNVNEVRAYSYICGEPISIMEMLQDRFGRFSFAALAKSRHELSDLESALYRAWVRFVVARRVQFAWGLTGEVPPPWEERPELVYVRETLVEASKRYLRGFLNMLPEEHRKPLGPKEREEQAENKYSVADGVIDLLPKRYKSRDGKPSKGAFSEGIADNTVVRAGGESLTPGAVEGKMKETPLPYRDGWVFEAYEDLNERIIKTARAAMVLRDFEAEAKDLQR